MYSALIEYPGHRWGRCVLGPFDWMPRLGGLPILEGAEGQSKMPLWLSGCDLGVGMTGRWPALAQEFLVRTPKAQPPK